MLIFLLYSFFSFLMGGIMFSYHLPKIFKGIDLVKISDDKNPGSYNAIKYCGKIIGLICLLCDILKGFIPIFFACKILDVHNLLFSVVILSPVLGHAVAPYYKFKGGKSIATSFGVLIGLIPKSYIVIILAILYILNTALLKIKPNEHCTIITFISLVISSVLLVIFTKNYSFCLGIIFLSSVVIYKNHSISTYIPLLQDDEKQKELR